MVHFKVPKLVHIKIPLTMLCLAKRIQLVLDLGKARFGMAVVIGSSVNGDTIELAFLDLLPKLGVEIFTLEDLYPRANFSIGKMLSVAGLENVILHYGELRDGLHIMIHIAFAD